MVTCGAVITVLMRGPASAIRPRRILWRSRDGYRHDRTFWRVPRCFLCAYREAYPLDPGYAIRKHFIIFIISSIISTCSAAVILHQAEQMIADCSPKLEIFQRPS